MNGWIKMSRRKPPVDTIVIACDPDYYDYCVAVGLGSFKGTRSRWQWEREDFDISSGPTPVYWHPLPDPPVKKRYMS